MCVPAFLWIIFLKGRCLPQGMLVENLAWFVLASLILIKSASISVKSVLVLAKKFNLTPFIGSFVIAGLVSIAPELLVGINSALENKPALGVGTIVGGNMLDLTIVLGLVALLGRRLTVQRTVLQNNVWFVMLCALPVVLMSDNVLSRADGLALVIAGSAYLFYMVRRQRVFEEKPKTLPKHIERDLLVFLLGMALLFVSAHYVVVFAEKISLELSLPLIFTGFFLVAFGTVLPELTFSLQAVLSRHKAVALGDILGNVAIDSSITIGVVALIAPVYNNFAYFASGALFMVFAALLVTTLLNENKRITSTESLMLFGLYILFMTVEWLLQSALN